MNCLKRIKKKMPAFTLMEVMTVMAISAGVVGISYWCYEVFGRQFENYRIRSEETLHIASLNQALGQDFPAARLIRRTQEGITCIKPDSVQVKYAFYQTFILRKVTGVTDTFNIEPLEVNLQFERQPAVQGSLIDELQLSVVSQKENHYLHYLKAYGADVLMEEDQKEQGNGGY